MVPVSLASSHLLLKLAPRPAIIPHAKINPKWIEDLNASRDTIKVLAENTGSEISYIPQSNTFANASPRTRKIKEKKNKQMGLHQIKKLLHSERNHHQHEEGRTVWENIFANDISDKGLISKIYKELI